MTNYLKVQYQFMLNHYLGIDVLKLAQLGREEKVSRLSLFVYESIQPLQFTLRLPVFVFLTIGIFPCF